MRKCNTALVCLADRRLRRCGDFDVLAGSIEVVFGLMLPKSGNEVWPLLPAGEGSARISYSSWLLALFQIVSLVDHRRDRIRRESWRNSRLPHSVALVLLWLS